MRDEFWLEEMSPDGFSAADGIIRGDPGPYFTPAVDVSGNISWTNNGNLPNPQTQNIKGDKGDTGDDGVSPTITITNITGGHRVTIADAEHPLGQSIDVMDGASAYEQAVAGGYTGTEAQFNAELAAFKDLSEQAASAATAAAGSATDAAGSATQAAKSASYSDTSALKAEGFSVGKQNGTDVGSGSPYYHNNAIHYSQLAGLASGSASNSALAASGSATAAANSASAAEASAAAAAASEAHTYTPTTVSGSIPTFDAPAEGLPLKKLEVQIVPAQAGSGDPSPQNVRSISEWTACNVTRTGKNRLSKDGIYQGSLGTNGTANTSDTTRCFSMFIKITPGSSYTFSCESGIVIRAVHTYKRKAQTGDSWNGRILNESNSVTFTAGSSDNYCRAMFCKTNYSAAITPSEITSPQMEAGATATTYEPYIGTDKTISFPTPPGTVYGGTLTIHDDGTGELKSRPYYASYNGETLVGPWLSSMDVYAEGTTPSTGAQVVDMGGAETVYFLTAEQIPTLLGTNNIWADTGDVSVEYGAYLPATNGRIDGVKNDLLNLCSCIAPIENGSTASQAYAQGAYFFHSGDFCKAKTSIASGATFTLNTNYEVTSVAAELLTAVALTAWTGGNY